MNVNLDLRNDFENAVLADIEAFKNNGFLFLEYDEWKNNQEQEDNSENKYKQYLIYSYANLRQRIINAKPRKILFANNFSRLPDYEDGLKFLENKIINGEDLIPHLSRQIFNPNEQDGMLFDFGIYHLHLGTTPDTRYPFLIQGREKILYCLFDNDFAYFLVIDNHGRWNDLSLLRIIKNNFPQKLDTWEMKNVILTFNPTEQERLKLRKSGVNMPIELDGKFYISPGGGINTAGTSAMAVMEMNRYYRRYKRFEKIIREHFANDNELETKFQINSLNLSLQSFMPFVLTDNENRVTVELIISNDVVEKIIVRKETYAE